MQIVERRLITYLIVEENDLDENGAIKLDFDQIYGVDHLTFKNCGEHLKKVELGKNIYFDSWSKPELFSHNPNLCEVVMNFGGLDTYRYSHSLFFMCPSKSVKLYLPRKEISRFKNVYEFNRYNARPAYQTEIEIKPLEHYKQDGKGGK